MQGLSQTLKGLSVENSMEDAIMPTGIDNTVFSGIPQQWYGHRDANGAATGPGGYAKVGLSNMSALTQAGADEPVMDMLTLSNHSLSSLDPLATHKPLMEMELQTTPPTFTYNGREFYVNHSDYESFLNDPDLKVSETGWLTKTTGYLTGTITVHLIGRAVDAPEYTPPKYTADFFDASADFITKAAQEYAKTGSDETLTTPYYSGDKFVKSALDFFSTGNYTQADVDRMKASVESIIKELAEMIKNGEEADLSKVKGKVDIMGKQISLTQLLEMQEYGKELSNQLVGEKREFLGFGNDGGVEYYARRGLIKSMGMSYGDQIGGDAGDLFKTAWGAEVDRHSQIFIDIDDRHRELIMKHLDDKDKEGTILHGNLRKNGAQWIYDVFSKIDTSSKENALKSYKALSGEIDAAINKFYGQYSGVPGGMVAKMRNEVDSYFYDLMGFNSVNVTA